MKTRFKLLIATLLMVIMYEKPGITGMTIGGYANSFWDFIKTSAWPRMTEIVTSPIHYPKVLWMIIPLLITILFMQMYFGRWKTEKLGWNSALGNVIALLFITVNLISEMVKIYDPVELATPGPAMYKAIIITAIILQIFIMMALIFFHVLSSRIGFFLGSQTTTYVVAFVAIVLVFSDIPIDKATFGAFILLYILVQIFFAVFRWAIPPSKQVEQYLERKKKELKKEKQQKRKNLKDKIHRRKKRFYKLYRKRYLKVKHWITNLFK